MAGESFMDRARDLAERGRYTAAPTPLVGVVLTRDGEVIGEGWHERAGQDHAEIVALKQCGPAARGATMFTTLEPCNHHGRTPPCTDAILEAGIAKVVIGDLDPNPKMRGRSAEILRDAGVEVEVRNDHVFEHQNEQFDHLMKTGRPFVHLKLAATLDGRIATSTGDSKWITGEAARQRAHLLRAEAGAVLVGAGTVRADDPAITARNLPQDPPPITRVVLDPSLTTTSESQLVRTASETPVIIFSAKDSLDGSENKLEPAGVEVIGAPPDEDGLDLLFVLEELGRRGIRGLLVEGGGETAGWFIRKELVDKMTVFYAPKLAGADGVPMIGALGLQRMKDAPLLSIANVEVLGDDVAMTLYPYETEEEDVHRAG